jgi:hypothetical protein
MKKKDRLNNFQRQETTRLLLNIAHTVVIGGAGGWFIPGIGVVLAILLFLASLVLAALLYALAMLIGKEVKNAN